MIKIIRFLLSLSSFSGVLFFLLVGKRIDIPFITLGKGFINEYVIVKYVIFLVIILFFSWFVIFIAKKILSSGDNLTIKEIKPIEGTFLPVYIGLFVIALSLGNTISIENIFLLIILFVFWVFLESVSYFNPFLLVFGYRFYEVKTKLNTTIILITKKVDFKNVDKDIEVNNLIRINNFTYLEK